MAEAGSASRARRGRPARGAWLAAMLLAGRAPAGLVTGTVHEIGTPEPVIGAAVGLAGSTVFTETDADGRFRLEVPDGPQTLTVAAPGFETGVRGVGISAGKPLVLDVALERAGVRADEVVVRGRRDAAQPGQVDVSREEIKSTPGTAGDALRAVQALPGVVVVNDMLGQIAVRGGGPADNLYLLDGIPWPVPFHFGGIMSTVNSDLLQRVDLYPAAFDARWGNAHGAVLDAHTRPAAKDRAHAVVGVNMVVSEGLFETPLGIGDASVAIGGRRSYFDLIFGPMFRDTFTAFPLFWDLGGSLDVSVTPQDRVRATGLTADDSLGLILTEDMVDDPHVRGDFHMRDTFRTGGATWTTTRVPGLTSRLTPYAYQVADSLGSTGLFTYEGRHRVTGIKEEASWEAGGFLAPSHTVGFGGSAEWVKDTLYVRVAEPDEDLHDTTVDGNDRTYGAWVQDRAALGRGVALTLGGRWDRSTTVAAARASAMPRASMEWKAGPATTLRTAWGRYEQFPQGWQLNPDYGNPRLGPERAEHAVLGAERQFSPELLGRLEVYDKRYRDLVTETDDGRKYANEGTGTARGAETFVKLASGERFFGWVSYAYSVSRRRDHPGEPAARYEYDQPHVATVVASWAPHPRWRIGTKLRYNSGPLVTPLAGRFQDASGDWQPVWGPAYSRRLGDYFRCDLRAEFAHQYNRSKLILYLEVLNVLNLKNPAGIEYSRDYAEAKLVGSMPLIPYLGVEARF